MADGRKVFEFGTEKAVTKSNDDGAIVVGEFDLKNNGVMQTYYIRALVNSSTAVLVNKVRSSDHSAVIQAVLNFTEIALTPESAERFAKVALHPIKGLEIDQIIEVFRYVLSVTSANPIGSASALSTPQPKPGTRSTAASRSKASTP